MVPWEVLTILSKPGLGPQKRASFTGFSRGIETFGPIDNGLKTTALAFFGYPFSVLKIHRPQRESTGVRSAMLRIEEMWDHGGGGNPNVFLSLKKKTSGFIVESVSLNLRQKNFVSWGVSSDFVHKIFRTSDGDRQPSRSKMAHWRQGTVRAYDVLVLHVLDNFSILAMSKPIFSTVITIIC